MKYPSPSAYKLTRYTYDERGNCISESDGTSTKSYTYNVINQRDSYTLTVNGVVKANASYTYDIMHRLATVTTNYSTTTYTYDTWGNRTSEATSANSGYEAITLYGYDAANRLTALNNIVDGSFVTIENYVYNLDGSMQSKTAGDETSAYAYDGAGRLTVEVKGSAVKTYGYDAANNRTSMYDNGTTTTYTYDANNRMLTETVGGSTKTYTYDANGNMLTGNGATYTYNARGQQASYSKNGTTATYSYLPTGLRKSKTVVLNTTNYVWDGQNLAYEYTGANTVSGKAYFYGLTLISQGNSAYYLYNGHGDVVQLCNGSGTLTREYDYDAFGNEVSPNASDTNPFRYAGQYYDTETGTYYLRARYYDPSVGRFTQQDGWVYADPGDPLSLNLYTYCWNDPILYIDIMGCWPTWSQVGQVAFIVGAATISIVAIAATAGAASAAVGTGVAIYLNAWGASATTVTAITSMASAGAYGAAAGVAIGVGAVATSEVGEVFTGHNVIRDNLMGGNQTLYDGFRTGLNVFGAGIVQLGSPFISYQQDSKKTSQLRTEDIRYTQDSIKSEFTNGNSLQDTIQGLKNGEISANKFPPIRIFEKDGKIYSLDNRRLYVAKQAGVQINYTWASEAEIQRERYKFTTKNDGISIRVRGGE